MSATASTYVDARTTPEEPPRSRGPVDIVWVVAGLAVLARLPFVTAPAGADEAGFLQVAQQWRPGGGSLYGSYWVDRPPLLITLFQVADVAGGLVSLRLIGCVAVAVTVLMCARAARLLAGSRGATWAALVASALLVSPAMGSLEINGELLAAPFVAAGLTALIEATQAKDRRRALLLAGMAGAAGVCALLVKQNVIDVAVFASIYLITNARSGRAARSAALAGAAVVGAAGTLGAIALWTLVHGTSLVGVWDAMYPFRLQAAHVLAAEGSQYSSLRAVHLATTFVTSGAAVLAVTLLVSTVRRHAWDAAVIALAATAAYDVVSIAVGGGYWLHYLVEGVVPLAVWAGVLIGRGATAARIGPVVVTAATALALGLASMHPSSSPAGQVGAAIGRAARPGDTLTALYGAAQVNLAAHLPSPYEHLWSLPIKTRDPHLVELDDVLAGPRAPTWLVVVRGVGSWGLDTARTGQLIATRYRVVTRIDGETVYLRDGVERAAPSPVPTTRSTIIQEHP